MKKQHITASSAKSARRLAPWSAKVVKVYNGYMAFESVTEAKIFKKQK